MSRTLFVVAATALLAVAAACANATPNVGPPAPGTQVNLFAPTAVLASATVPALTPAQQFDVLLGDNSIRPINVTLPLNQYIRVRIADTGPDCKFSIGDYVQGLAVSNQAEGEVTFDVTPLSPGTPTPTAQTSHASPPATPPTVSTPTPSEQRPGVPQSEASPTGVAAPVSGNAPPNQGLMGCDGQPTRAAALAIGATPVAEGQPPASALPATPTASITQLGLLLQPNSVRPSRLQIPFGQEVHLVIDNPGGACRFSMGPVVQSLAIPASGSADLTFVLRSGDIATPVPASGFTAGCAGDPSRQVPLAIPSSAGG